MAKQFNRREKALITSIYNAKDSNTYVLTNVFEQWMDPAGAIRFDLAKGKLIFDLDIYKEANEILNVKKSIISTALLVKYLEDENYIYIIQDDTNAGQPNYVGAQNIRTPLIVDVPIEIGNIIKRSLYNVYVSYDLIALVENGFRTYEDLQLIQASTSLEAAKIQIKIGLASLFVSALALIFTLVINLHSNCAQNKHNETMLNTLAGFQANFCALNNENTLELCAHIDSLGVSFNQQNTKNVNVTKTTPQRVSAKKQYNLIQIDTINCDGKQFIVLPIKR